MESEFAEDLIVTGGLFARTCRRTPVIDGYIDGVRDARFGRSPEHSHSAYQFPHNKGDQAGLDYNRSYDDAKRDMAAANRVNLDWIATHCHECFQVITSHHEDCPELKGANA